MKTMLYSASLVMLAVSANAQNNAPPIQPNELTTTVKTKPPLQLSDDQRRKIQDALVTAHSAQKTPENFEANEGPHETQARCDPNAIRAALTLKNICISRSSGGS